jgi:hypothetical protein
MIECGVCANDLAKLVRVVKSVGITDPEGKPVKIYDLCKSVAAQEVRLPPEIDLPSLATDLYRTYQAMHHREPGVVRLKAFKGYIFTVKAEEKPIQQPKSFDGTAAEAKAAGWEPTDRGWICPGCKPDAHRPEESEAGFGGLEDFFEETRDL